jgi:hypothetical protein
MIAHDTSTYGGDGVASFSHTCTGSNLLLIVAVNNPNQDITGVTYNGVAMTQQLAPTGAGNLAVYSLLNPATGSNTVAATGMGGSSSVMIIAASYTGVKQTAFPDSKNNDTTNLTPRTLSTTVVASNCWLINCGAGIATSHDPAITTNRTDRKSQTDINTPFSSFALVVGDSNGTVSTGSQSTIFTTAGTLSPSCAGVFSLSAEPAPVRNSNFFALMK